MNRMHSKVAVVTGGALGIGRATSLLLAREGAAVAITDVMDGRGRALADKIVAEGGTAAYWNMNVAIEHEVANTFDAIIRKFGEINVLVNNVGIGGTNKPTHEITEAEWDALMRVNVNGVFFCTKHAIPSMRRARGGSIVYISSLYGLVGGADLPPYHASKGAVRLMAKTDATLYARDNIRVNSIHPGFIWTPMMENITVEQGDQTVARQALDRRHPMGHVGEPDDIAYGVLYLASDESKFVTGSELVIDGGYTAR